MDEILIEVYEDKLFRGYAAGYYPSLVDEIISELTMSLITLDSAKLTGLHKRKELKYYCLAVIRNMCVNKSSPFRRANTSTGTQEINEEVLNIPSDETVSRYLLEEGGSDLEQEIKTFLSVRAEEIDGKWYDEKLFNMYFVDDKSYRKISKSTGIPTSSIYHNVKLTQEIVVNEFKDKYNDIRD